MAADIYPEIQFVPKNVQFVPKHLLLPADSDMLFYACIYSVYCAQYANLRDYYDRDGMVITMGKTIKGKLTMSVIAIVAVSILLTTVGIVVVAGRNLIQNQTEALQLNADRYAEEINTWIENEKM
ncbi:MAG: hypothetical protein NC489_45225, partial [Ruminococcus flavefaciens]|nr:hypothetical protein [Ruminococcus flavefaciens]